MPYCPDCRYEYRQGIITCPDCGAELVQELAPEPSRRPANEDDQWMPLISPGPDAETLIITNLLEAAGIPTIIRSDVTTIYPTTMIQDPGPAICVPSSRLADARQILQDAQDGSSELNWEVWQDNSETGNSSSSV